MALRTSLRTIACGLALGLSFGTSAMATVQFTWNPSATGNSSHGPFTADSFVLSDFATISVPSNPSTPGSVTETGFLFPTVFNLGTTSVATANVPGSTFGMYEQFTATSHLTGCATGLCGAFDTITASVFVYSTAKGVATVTFPSGVPKLKLPSKANPVLVATESGPAHGSPNFVSITQGVPGAGVDTFFTPNPAQSGFFVSPPVLTVLDLEQAFTNTIGVIVTIPGKCKTTGSLPCEFEIRGGGGNGDFISAIPEAASFTIFGVALAGLGLIRRGCR